MSAIWYHGQKAMPVPMQTTSVGLERHIRKVYDIIAAIKAGLHNMQAERKDASEAAASARSAAAAPAELHTAEDSPDADASTNPFANPPKEASNPFLVSAPVPVLAPPPRASGETCACVKVMALQELTEI